MALISPSTDPNFSNNKAHGSAAQLSTLNKVVALCEQRRTALDVGAHIGTWTVELAKRFTSVYAFEPQPENFACLQANVGAAAKLENVALSYELGRCSVVKHNSNSGCWRVSAGEDTPVRSIDSYSLLDVDLIKIDVEGYEGHVIAGAVRTLLHCRPVVIVEDNGLGEKFYGRRWIDPKPILKELGYSLRKRINKDEIWSK